MIADPTPYAEYTESALPWLRQLPKHWMPVKLKHAFKRIIGGSTPASGNPRYWNGDIAWVTPADVSRSERLRRSMRRISRTGMLSCSLEMVPRGSIIITSRAPVGNVAIAEVDLCTSQGCKALIPDPAVVEPMFAFWLLSFLKPEIQSLSTGTTFSEVSTSRLGSTVGVLPPLADQMAIVRLLNWANGRLERAIRAKRKVIALLNEQKQAIIHRAVTRGLDPSVPLKPSGMPWLGDIPQHWEVRALKRVVATKITDGPHETPALIDSGVDFMSAESMVNGRFVFEKRRGFISRELHEQYCVKCRPRRHDVFMCKSGATTGKVAIVETEREFSVWSPLALLRANTAVMLPRFLFVSLQTKYVQQQVQERWSFGTQPNLSMAAMGRISIAVPTLLEQERALGQIEQESSPLTAAISRLEREIDLLREYRTRLVADVVTGKLDVREAAARLPDEAPLDSVEADADLGDEGEAADEEAAA